MKKLLAAVAISAFALTSAAPMVQAAQPTGVHKAQSHNVHKVAQKKKAKASGKKKKTPTKTSQAATAPIA